MPWMVAMFGILVIPLGLTHIALVMSQPVVVHHWSTLALLAAAVMLPMITLTVDEVVAMGQHLRDAIRRGDRGGSAWKIFWLGGKPGDSAPDDGGPDIADLPDAPGAVVREGLVGASAPWTLVAMTLLGVWLLAAPGVFDLSIRSHSADLAHIGGAVIVVAAVVAMAEPVRLLRFLGAVAGLAVAGLALATSAPIAYVVALILTGLAVAAVSVPRGPVHETYGDWYRWTR